VSRWKYRPAAGSRLNHARSGSGARDRARRAPRCRHRAGLTRRSTASALCATLSIVSPDGSASPALRRRARAPIGSFLPYLGRGPALIAPVVPFLQIRIEDGVRYTRELAVRRARPAGLVKAAMTCLAPTAGAKASACCHARLGQRDVGFSRCAAGSTPLGLPGLISNNSPIRGEHSRVRRAHPASHHGSVIGVSKRCEEKSQIPMIR
jgi:hypothetical protein